MPGRTFEPILTRIERRIAGQQERQAAAQCDWHLPAPSQFSGNCSWTSWLISLDSWGLPLIADSAWIGPRMTIPQKFTKSVLPCAMLWLSPWSVQSFWKIGHYATITFDYASGPPALRCRAGKQSNDNGFRSGWRGCLRRFAGKGSNLPEYVKPPTPISAISQICSSNAFGLASAPVSLKPSRPRPLPGARNESTAFAESLRAVECVPGRKKALAIRRRFVQESQRQKSRNGRALNSE